VVEESLVVVPRLVLVPSLVDGSVVPVSVTPGSVEVGVVVVVGPEVVGPGPPVVPSTAVEPDDPDASVPLPVTGGSAQPLNIAPHSTRLIFK
jgi:hypothetical protein